MDILIRLNKKEDEQGRTFLEAQYDENDLNGICLALLCDDNMKNTALLAAAMAIAQEENPEAMLAELRNKVTEIRNDNEYKAYNI